MESIPKKRSEINFDKMCEILGRSFNVRGGSEQHKKAIAITKLIIMKNKYILTLDYTAKMLNINERKKAKLPVILQGETGIGKSGNNQIKKILKNYKII